MILNPEAKAHHSRAALLAARARSPILGDGAECCWADRVAGELSALAGDDSGESNKRNDPGVLSGGRRLGVTPAMKGEIVNAQRVAQDLEQDFVNLRTPKSHRLERGRGRG